MSFSKTIATVVVAVCTTAAVWATELSAENTSPSANHPRPLDPPKAPPRATVAIPAPEPSGDTSTKSGDVTVSPFATSSATSGTTLTGPATMSYSGSSVALTITDTGTGRGIITSLTNSSNINSALYGETSGRGAGLTGFNNGTAGPGGKFQVTNTNSGQPAIYATTAGYGSAIQGVASNYSEPVIYDQNTNTIDGTGVEGEGTGYGVYGSTTTGSGVYGSATMGFGVTGFSSGNNQGQSAGVYGSSSSGYGVYGYSSSNIGVYAYSQSDTALYAYSEGSYAGWFQRSIYVEGSVTANSYQTASDKNIKEHFKTIDRKSILDQVRELPVSSWDFKADKKKLRHVGPMAQDFHALFHLNGDDDTHINLADLAGVTIAAVQELSNKMKAKDAQIAELKSQLAAQEKTVASMAEAFSTRMTALEHQRDTRAQTVALAAPSSLANK